MHGPTKQLLAAAVALLLTGCSWHPGPFNPQATVDPESILTVRTSGPRSASKALTTDLEDHVVRARCSGSGTMTIRAVLGDADVTDKVPCPTETSLPAVNVEAKKTIRLEITDTDADVDGIVELIPA